MEKKFLSKAVMYRCTELSWWNDGTERKPNKWDFQDLQFEPLKNHNMKWVSLFNIELTIPVEYEFNFFKLTYTKPQTTDPFVEYYYVEKVLDINSRNKKMLLTLDIWCTYIISPFTNYSVKEIHQLESWTNRYLPKTIDNETGDLTFLKQIPPFGYLTDDYGITQIEIFKDINKDFEKGIWNNCFMKYNEQPSWKEYTYEPTKNINRTGANRYYVFSYSLPTDHGKIESNTNFGTTRKQSNYSVQSGIILIPSLFESVGCYINSDYRRGDFMFESLKFKKEKSNPSAWSFKKNKDWVWPSNFFNNTEYHLFNDELNLIRLAERLNEHKSWSGLTRFLGVHYGENFFKLINKYNLAANRYESFESPSTKWSTLYWTGTSASTLTVIDHENFLEMGGYDNGSPNNRIINLMGFACVKIPPDGLDILSNDIFNNNKDIVRANALNRHYLGNPDYSHNFGNKKLYFTDRFVICNDIECKEYNSEVPLMLDDYYNVLQATKPQRDAALRSAVGSFIASGVNNWVSPALHGQGVYAEKTAWGQYWEDAGSFYGSSGHLKSLKNTKFGENPIEPWSGIAFKNSASYEENVLSKNYKAIGKSDKLMGKISRGLGIVSSVGSVINSSVQLASTIDGLIQSQKIIRYQTGASLTSTSSAFLKNKYFLDLAEKSLDRTDNSVEVIMSLWFREIYCGLSTSFSSDLFEYYGVEMGYKKLSLEIGELRDNWIVLPEGETLYRNFYKLYKHILRNDIIEAIVKMLTQGVRVLPKP